MPTQLKIASIRCGNKYLKGFEPNEFYSASVRGIGGRYNGAEFDPVWSDGTVIPRFDLITLKGYLNLLAEYERWNDSDSATYVVEFKR